jgi:hypothetical protein
MKMKYLTLAAAVFATVFAAFVSSVLSPGGMMISYLESIIAGSIAASFFLVLAIHAWGKEPPLEGLAWVFGHLGLWAAAYTAEEISWAFFTLRPDLACSVIFAERIAPFLKASQGTALAGLMVFAWYYSKGVSGDKLSARLRASWAACMLLSSFMIFMQGTVFNPH